ncbi:unnamed protein product [Phytophthora lilii]|uniref:Unnamed protein product n=1 Tax=Phytophthora lilii TaxID=2077276 RepID=A0A9W6XJW4_9STRA|nr:unnamed protein product [Phytophthora lilii]
MSSASDISAYAHSVEPAKTLFNSTNWTYIQDSTSNTGQYSGQIQFNLSTISSQAAFVNWSEAVIELPIKLQITNAGASSITTTAAASYDQPFPKAGAWHFLTPFRLSLMAGLKMIYLTTGPTSTFALDKFEPPVPAMDSSLENLALSKFQNTKAYDFCLSNTFINMGARERAKMTAVDPTSTKLSNSILGSSANAQAAARPQVWTAAARAIATGAPINVAHYIATIRLADISDYFK